MIKLDIKKLEKALGYKIKKNIVSIGFDTAKRTGLCQIETNSKHAMFDFSFLEFQGKSDKQMYRFMVQEFANVLAKQDVAIIEDVFVGFSRAGSITLARFGAFVISECIRKKIPYELIKASPARAKLRIDARKFGKGKSKESVAFWINEKLGIKLDDEDISDAIVLALLGICEGINYE